VEDFLPDSLKGNIQVEATAFKLESNSIEPAGFRGVSVSGVKVTLWRAADGATATQTGVSNMSWE
jgi:hypothetical protein